MMAHGSHEVLKSASIFDSFEEAVSDLDLLVCTTSKGRTSKHDYLSVKELTRLLEDKACSLEKVGILFGTEESGLPNNLILKSDLAITIPMHAAYPSLNLAQSVMVTAYELSPLNQLAKPGTMLSKTGEGWAELKRQSRKLLEEAGIREGTPLYHRIIERLSVLGASDIPLLLSVVKRVNKSHRPSQSSSQSSRK
jgi:tRNA/rRNA methyltransferase